MKKKDVMKLLELYITGKDNCERCAELGQVLKDCKCKNDRQCSKHIIKLWKKQGGN